MGLCASRTAGILCVYSCTECNMHRVIDLVIGRKMLINVESTLSQRGEGGLEKEYGMHACDNVDNYERPLTPGVN